MLGITGAKRITCCFGCNDRYVGCHAECERYLTQKQSYETERSRIKDGRAERSRQTADIVNGIRRMKRGKR